MPTIAAYVKKAKEQGVSLSRLILEEQSAELEKTPEELFEKMKERLQVMKESAKEGENPEMRSASGLTGGASAKVMERVQMCIRDRD